MSHSSSLFLKNSFLCISGLLFSNSLFASEPIYPKMKFSNSGYYIACYYYDTKKGLDNDNPNLMYPSIEVLTFGARKNYAWAVNGDSIISGWTKLTGKIQDGFFLEEKYSYADIVSKCNFAIQKINSSFKLYEFKASTSDFDGYEYPIQFAKAEQPNSKIKQIVLFGDSLSDPGNLKRWAKIMPFFPFWNGRFTDGYVWNDYLTERTHLPVLNFAYGGAKTDGTNDAFANNIPTSFVTAARNLFTGSSKYYVNSYMNSYLTNDSYYSTNQKLTNTAETLFVLWIGANDFLEKFENNQPAHAIFDNPDSVGGVNYIYKRAVDNIINQIKMLNNIGANHFMIINLPDIGKTPAIVTSNYNKYSDDVKNKNEFSLKMTEAIQKYNFYLDTSLKLLKDNLGNKINIKTLDIASDFEKLMNNKNILDDSSYDYGFSKMDTKYKVPGSKINYIQDFCYNGGYYKAALTQIGKETNIFANKNNSCVDENGKRTKLALFWNSPHPSSYAHCWVSYALEKQLNDDFLINTKLENLDSYKNYCLSKLN